MKTTRQTARLILRVPSEFKDAIAKAAALAGQTVSDFATSALTQRVRTLSQKQRNTLLSKWDRDVFIRLLDRTECQTQQGIGCGRSPLYPPDAPAKDLKIELDT